jgi:hypothetical protein
MNPTPSFLNRVEQREMKLERSNVPLLGTWFLLHITFPE